MYVGVRNMLICYEMGNAPGVKSRELWRRELGELALLHKAEPSVVFSAGRVVVRYLKSVFGFDPDSGNILWKAQLDDYGWFDIIVTVVNGGVVYYGVLDSITAISAVNGQRLWQFRFGQSLLRSIPTIVCCGLCIFVASGSQMACLNAANGSVRWKNKYPNGSHQFPATGAWDGQNTVLLGQQGYLFPIDLASGIQRERINLKGTGFHNVTLTFNRAGNCFYAFTNGVVFAVSGGNVNSMLWRTDVNNGEFSTIAFEPSIGRIYVLSYTRVTCLATNGSVMFSKGYEMPLACRYTCAVALDIMGTGRILIGSGGYFVVIDAEGNQIENDDLKGMRYGQTYICTKTASVDPNASGQDYMQLEIQRRKSH